MKEKEENIWRGKIFGQWRRKRRRNRRWRKIFGHERRKRTPKEKEENILKKENIWSVEE